MGTIRNGLAVLGIDAAWTVKNPSGVALLSRARGVWRCVALAPSYESFIRLADRVKISWQEKARGSTPEAGKLLEAARRLLDGKGVSVVAIDMPISKQTIVGRRKADNAVSAAFGNTGCAVHSPSRERPGHMGKRLTSDLRRHGYPLAVRGESIGAPMRLIEVYPHPALLTLLRAKYRVPYKVGKSAKYWPDVPIESRKRNLLCEHHKILNGLRLEIEEIELGLPSCQSDVKSLSGLKPYEDALDALISAWVAIKYLEGKARPYGDDSAAIWIPV